MPIGLITALLLAATNPPSYVDKEERTGTRIPQVVRRSVLPLNKTYEEFTDEEKAVLRSQYVGLAPDDEPPFPREGIRTMLKAGQTIARKLRVRGEIAATVYVDEQGNAEKVDVFRSPDPEFADLMSRVLLVLKYKPALCAGKPCKMGFPVLMRFGMGD